MQTHTFIVESKVWLKIGICFALLTLSAISIGFGWLVFDDSMASYRIILCIVSVMCILLILPGLNLVRFMNHKLEVTDESLTVHSPSGTSTHRWDEIRIRDKPRLQITEIADSKGDLLYAFDWLATNAEHFRTTSKLHIQNEA